MSSRRLILASSSPQRRQLLEKGGYHFEIIPPDDQAECGVCSSCGPAQLVLDLALRKAADVVKQLADRPRNGAWVVVACDTVAECGGEILGKPRDREHAASMLRRLRGAVHRVYSGVCVWSAPGMESSLLPKLMNAVSELRMDQFDDEELEEYLDSELWQGKAGAFGLQDRPRWIRLESGSFSNVVGLPMEILEPMLMAAGIVPSAAPR